MKFIILCPFAIRTGGPEALFQLSDSLIRNGFDAELWLITNQELEAIRKIVGDGKRLFTDGFEVAEKVNSIAEYAGYKHKIFKSYSKGQPITFVLPEVYTWMTPALLSHRIVVWWLSVDNAFHSLSQHNLNILRLPNVVHAAQSAYASNFLKSLGLDSSRLSDYTVTRGQAVSLAERPLKVAMNARRKVIFNLDSVIERLRGKCPDVEVVKIGGLSREEVYDAFTTSRLFIDLGNFPGKDRMAREALALGTNLIISNSGSGRFYQDYPIPDTYRVHPHNTEQIVKLAAHMIMNPVVHEPFFDVARNHVSQERATFDGEVLSFFVNL